MTDRPTAATITEAQLDELYADLDRYEDVQGDMNEQAIDSARAIAYFEMQLGRLRDQLAILAGNRPTPEQLRGEHTADKALARRIHQARPGVPVQHVLATLEAIRALREMEPAPDTPAPPARVDWPLLLGGFESLLKAFPTELNADGPAVSCRPQPAQLVARWRDTIRAARQQYANQTTKEN